MPDCTKSTLSPRLAQQSIEILADALRSIDRQLERIVQDLDTSGDELLPKEIIGTVDAVRRDLLIDAIETLISVATKSEEDVIADCERVLYLVEAAR